MFTLLCIVSQILKFVDGVSSEDVSTSVSAKFIGSFSCNGGLTSGPGFLAIDGGALIVSRFTGDPLESDDVASVSDFAERIIAGTISTATCNRVAALTWPNDVEPVSIQLSNDKNSGENSELFNGLLVPGGFLVPPKTIGGINLINSSNGEISKGVYTLSTPKILPGDGYFYHRAVPVDIDGDGLLDILSARATKPLVTSPLGELIWLKQPATAPLEPSSLPWKETVLVSGAWSPDVLFSSPISIRGDNDSQVFYASFFTGGGLGMLQCVGCAGTAPTSTWATSQLTPIVLDASVGPAFDVAIVDINGDGRLDVLLTNHADNTTSINGTVYQSVVAVYEAPLAPILLTNVSAWTKHILVNGFTVREPGPNQAAPGAARAFTPPGASSTLKPWISVSGDGDQRVYILTPNSQNPQDWSYQNTLIHDCQGTSGRQVTTIVGESTYLIIPCYDKANIVVYEIS
jgi:hypothetical protein